MTAPRDASTQDVPPQPPSDTLDQAAKSMSSQQPTTIASGSFRYRTDRLHAKGGIGEVHLAHDAELGRTVALKRLQPERATDTEVVQRFLAEAEITARLEHPGIVPVYGLVRDDDGRPHYAMRFVEGDTLRDACSRYHRQPDHVGFRQLLNHFIAVCNTVAYAHSRGVIHRDLKPANILIGKFGETLVVDWGLAKVVGRSGVHEHPPMAAEATLPRPTPSGEATQEGAAMGTPAFMSPEQAAGRLDLVGPAADIYSLGATLYYLLTNQAPYDGLNAQHIVAQVMLGTFAVPRQVKKETPPGLDAICCKAMAKVPGQRYATATALAADLEQWLADEPVRAYREPPVARTRRWMRKHRTLVGSVVAALVVTTFGSMLTAVLLSTRNTELSQAHALADKRFAMANDAVDKYLNTVTDDEDLHKANFGELRKKLLETALPFYEELAAQKPEDNEQEAALGRAYSRLAQVRDEMGEKTKAQAACEQCKAMFTRLAAAFPAEPRYRRDQAKSHSALSKVLSALGERDKAEQEVRQALSLQRPLTEEFPKNPDYRVDLAASLIILGNVLRERDKREEMWQVRQEAIQLQEQLTIDFPSVPEYRYNLAATYNNLGNALRDQDKRAEARQAFQQAIDHKEKLAAIRAYRLSLATSYDNLGRLFLDLQELKAARAAYERAFTLRKQWASVAEYEIALGDSYINFGILVMKEDNGAEAKEDNGAEALSCYQCAIDKLGPVHDLEPRLVEAKQLLRKAHWYRAEARTYLRQYNEAAKDWDRAIALDDSSDKSVRAWLRLGRADNWVRLGEIVQATMEVEELLKDAELGAERLYDAARVFALASGKTKNADAKRAMAVLRQAVAKGYNNVAHLKKDPDLDPLRQRDDFQQFLAELEKK